MGYTSVFTLGTEYRKEILYEATQIEGAYGDLHEYDGWCIKHAMTRHALKYGIEIYDPPGDGDCLYSALAYVSREDPSQANSVREAIKKYG